jgi:hypothetical protein
MSGHAALSDDIAIHGSRAGGSAREGWSLFHPDWASDLDIAIRVSPEKFAELVQAKWATANPGSANWRTMKNAVLTGKIQAGEIRLSRLRQTLKGMTGLEVDISAIKIGGAFDKGPYIPIR